MNELLKLLEPELRSILDSELEAGNLISQVDTLWPRPGAICVQLKNRFKVSHRVDGYVVRFWEDRDPHGPVAEYVHTTSGNSLLCSLLRT